MTEKQLLAKYEKERAEVAEKAGVLNARLAAIDGFLDALRVMAGEPPKARPGRARAQATGTKALILDTLAGGQPLTTRGLADACQVTPEAIRQHLVGLIESGDVAKRGRGRSTTYVVP